MSVETAAKSERKLTSATLDDIRRVHSGLADAFPDHPVVSLSNVQLALAPLPAFVSNLLVNRNGDAVRERKR